MKRCEFDDLKCLKCVNYPECNVRLSSGSGNINDQFEFNEVKNEGRHDKN